MNRPSRRFLIALAATALPFLLLDSVWLTAMMPRLYAPRIGGLLLDRPLLLPALLFYAIYLPGVVVLAVWPSYRLGRPARQALGRGAVLGLVAYGTYDMTNLATLRGWSAAVTGADMAWGAVVTGIAAALGALAASRAPGRAPGAAP